MDWPALLAWRMRRQQLAERAPAREALTVISRIAGLHAQVMASADAALRARVDGLPDDFLPKALWRERTLVKTWAMRGTLHLLVREELPTYVGALSRPRPRHHQPAWQRAYGVTREQADAMLAAIPEVLARKPLTRAELAAAVARRTKEPHLEEKLSEGFGSLLKPAAFTGDLVFAEGDGQKVRFTTPDVEPEDGEEAVLRIVRIYLAVYGPAPREQFQRWFGLQSPAEAGRWLRAPGDEVVEVEQGWMLAADAEEAAAAAPCACCPPSTPTSWPRRARRTPSWRWPTATRSTARKAGSRPSCWSTASSAGPGAGRTTRSR
jgi:hypothetical protein